MEAGETQLRKSGEWPKLTTVANGAFYAGQLETFLRMFPSSNIRRVYAVVPAEPVTIGDGGSAS